MVAYEDIVERGVYFIFKPDESMLYHLSICLAEGLNQLGIPVFSNVDYWQQSPEQFLFKHEPGRSTDCAVCILDISAQPEATVRELIEASLNVPAPKYILNNSDFELVIPQFAGLEAVLRTHMSSLRSYPEHYIAWAFGISSRIEQAARGNSVDSRQKTALVNFRPTINQGVRIALEFAFTSHLSQLLELDRTIDYQLPNASQSLLNWQALGYRHIPAYYDRLKNSTACCCYGGNFIYEAEQPIISRWDSWRLWESFAAGCATIQLDFNQYGFLLPVMPENWQHYIGIDLANPSALLEKIQDRPNLFQEIAASGQEWALEHYSPIATASYFLDVVFGEPYGSTRELINLLTELSEA